MVTGEYDGWKNGAFASTTKIYGTTLEWTLDCEEYGVVWTGSVIEALQTVMEAKSTVTFTNTGTWHNISLSVKIIDIVNTITTKKFAKKYTLKLAVVA